MQTLDQTAEKCLFVVDEDNAVSGTLTDGDVRRAILSGAGLDDGIRSHYNPNPVSITFDNEAALLHDRPSLHAEARRLMHDHKVEVIPMLDARRRITGYVRWTDVMGDGEARDESGLDVPVVIMAGGYGTRLEPFTKVLPKPLIPVHDRPIIEHIIDRFVEVGADDFWLTVNYKSRIMKAYFHDREPSYNVRFVEEPEPMGTAGSLQFLKDKIDGPLFVTNCDIIIDADYRDIMRFHQREGHAITLVGSAVHYEIPYGTCVLNGGGSLSHINEKPRYDFIVNTGMYVLNADVLDLIPDEGSFHMTDLIDTVLKDGGTVGVFPVSENAWIDVGQWKEYERAAEKLEL